MSMRQVDVHVDEFRFDGLVQVWSSRRGWFGLGEIVQRLDLIYAVTLRQALLANANEWMSGDTFGRAMCNIVPLYGREWEGQRRWCCTEGNSVTGWIALP